VSDFTAQQLAAFTTAKSILAQGFTKDTAVAATQALYAADVSPKDAKEFLNSYQQPTVVPVAVATTVEQENDLMEAALACVARGWYVFALGERSKEPDGEFSPHGFKSSTNDPEMVRQIWTKKPNANYGIDLDRSNLTVLDFDNGKPPADLALPATLQVSTSRGTHVYYTGTVKQGKMRLNGEVAGDIKSGGGYVLGPGCVHPNGGVYTVIVEASIAPAPVAVVDALRPHHEPVDISVHGAKIPRGQHDNTLTKMARKMRGLGWEENAIYNALVEIVEKRCENYGSDYLEMCEKHAKRVCEKFPPGEDKSLLINQTALPSQQAVDVSNWRSLFRSVGQMEQGDVVMVIDGVLQEGTCFIGANPASGKTLIGLAFAKAICTGEPLFGQYPVKEPRTVLYLIPESRDRAFRKRCEAFRIPDNDKFLSRTISAGVPLELGDPSLLEAVRQTRPVVFLDTASRFMKTGDENSAAQNRMLVNDVTSLLAAGAVCVVILHHATKAAKDKRESMQLENMLRGTSDFGAMCDQAYGIRKDDALYANGSGPMEIDVVSLKDREQIGGLTSIRLASSYKKDGDTFATSYINETGNFRVVSDSQSWTRTLQKLVRIVKAEPEIPKAELVQRVEMSPYSVEQELKKLGWHRVQGGKSGASPWHQDANGVCPHKREEVAPMNEEKKTVKDAVAFLERLLEGTSPDGEYISEAEVYRKADKAGISDGLIAKARKRIGVMIGKEKGWSLPVSQPDGVEETVEAF
jgi:hypothetical protein